MVVTWSDSFHWKLNSSQQKLDNLIEIQHKYIHKEGIGLSIGREKIN